MSHRLLHAVKRTWTESVEGGGRTGEHEGSEVRTLAQITERRGSEGPQQKIFVL